MISSLRMMNFRCFEALAVEFSKRGVIITGANALGKTSLLEAICLLVRLQSPRTKVTGPMMRVGTQGFGLSAECWSSQRRLDYAPGLGLKMSVDNVPIFKQNDYLSAGGLIVWMGNDDLGLVRGSASQRRTYLDFLGCQLNLDYREHLHRYRRALRARNIILKEKPVREFELNAYTELLVKYGDYLTNFRARLVEMLESPTSNAQASISGKDEPVNLTYQAGAGEDFFSSLDENLERERRLAQTVVGPHRDDVSLTINGMQADRFASEGQQRTLALALKLAQGKVLQKHKNRTPVYLLDDIFGELDPARRNALLDVLPQNAQKLITTTHLSWMVGDFEILEIEKLLTT